MRKDISFLGYLCILAALCFLIVSCQDLHPTTDSTPSPETDVVEQATVQEVTRVIPVISTDTPQPIHATATEEIDPVISDWDEIPGDFLGSGVLYLLNNRGAYEDPIDDKLYSFSQEQEDLDQVLLDLEPGLLGGFCVTPDRNWMIFDYISNAENTEKVFILSTTDLQEKRVVPYYSEVWSNTVVGWTIDNEYLIIVPRHRPSYLLYLFNPFTKNQQLVEPVFLPPGREIIDNSWAVFGLSVAYDPTFTRVVYREDEDTMVLWDLEDEKELWRIDEPMIMEDDAPIWSPDGAYFVILDCFSDGTDIFDDELFQIVIVDRNGNEFWRSEELPYFTQVRSTGTVSWSPDSKHLLYHWLNEEENDLHTFILDINSFRETEYSFWGKGHIWAPDSSQLIFKQWSFGLDLNGIEDFPCIALDIESGESIHISCNDTLYPVAWMNDSR